MEFESDTITVGAFEEHVCSGSEIRKLSAQHQPPVKQVSRFKRLSKDEQCLDYAAFSHTVQATQQRKRRTVQLQAFEALEIRQLNLREHHITSSTNCEIVLKRFFTC